MSSRTWITSSRPALRGPSTDIKDIVITLPIAIALVTLVVYLFLQGWRAILIPLLAVPVSLAGTFVLFPAFGWMTLKMAVAEPIPSARANIAKPVNEGCFRNPRIP